MTRANAESLSPEERLQRLAVVFAVEIRLRIVVELYMREMSAMQFFRCCGGGSYNRIHHNFCTLEREGWLRHLYDLGPGGALHGGLEGVYRATEPPIMDAESWALLPYSVRATSSWNLYRQIAPRIRGNLESIGEETELKRDLTCTSHRFDEEGYARVIAAIRAQFARLFDEQEDSRRRAAYGQHKLTRADIHLIGFESPPKEDQLVVPRDLLFESTRDPAASFPVRLAPILRDHLRRAILADLNRHESSVTQFFRESKGASKPVISRRFKRLEIDGWVARGVTRTGEGRRGATEQFYRATTPAIDDFDPCDIPSGLRGTERWKAFEHLCEEIGKALKSGSFDRRSDRCLTWSLISLDRQGWENVLAEIEALSSFIAQEEKQARIRLAKSGEKGLEFTAALGAFEALTEIEKAP